MYDNIFYIFNYLIITLRKQYMKNFNPFFDKKMIPTMEWIIPDTNPIIRQVCTSVKFPLNDEDIEYIKKMVCYIDTSFYNKNKEYNITAGVAIAANQVGLLKRIIYFHFYDDNSIERQWLIANPIVIQKSNNISFLENGEGCLSVPEHHNGIVPRQSKIKFKAYDIINERNITIELEGYSAIVAQHELDHLDGILYYDHINVLNPNYIDEKWKKV